MIVFTVGDNDQLVCCVLGEGSWVGAFSDTDDALFFEDILVGGVHSGLRGQDFVTLSWCWLKLTHSSIEVEVAEEKDTG
jgi:hypothetical protein